MKLKQIPEDFIVEELFDDTTNAQKGGNFAYFELTKKNYAQMKAIEIVADTFNVERKQLRFAGTKDKVGITKQIISIQNLNKNNIQNQVDYLNEHNKDIQLKYLGNFNRRINLGDNLGNRFKIVIHDLNKEDTLKIKDNSKKIQKDGALNFFDEQRFGFANNSHIIGLRVLQNNLEGAVKEILISHPKDASNEHITIVEEIKNNWDDIKSQNLDIIDKIINLMPNYLRVEKKILEHLKKAKNDFPGSFRTIHKKLRTLYINAYQSYIFNELLKNFPQENEFPLLISSTKFQNEDIDKYVSNLLIKDNISRENFKLPSSPEYKFNFEVKRKTRIFPKNFKFKEEEKDELNENKLKLEVEFELEKGAYATNIIKQLFL